MQVSIIIPTYREAENIGPLWTRIEKALNRDFAEWEVWIMDDESLDGTREAVGAIGNPHLHLVERSGKRGLSPAVIEGMERAGGEVVVVMDADLSHPPETIPSLVVAIRQGAPFVIGSRYIPGASTDESWGLLRWINSKVATLLCRPLVRVSDPMAGFFALPRASFQAVRQQLNPVGYKIGLELLVKMGVRRAVEVPIHFANRTKGESKLSFKQQLLYLEHLRRLYVSAFRRWRQGPLIGIG